MSEDMSGEWPAPELDHLFEPFDLEAASASVRVALEELLEEADGIADRLAVQPAKIAERERELDELEDLRIALLERTEAANERFGAAERMVEQSRARLAEIADAHSRAEATLESANRRAADIVTEAEARAAALQEHAERQAVARIRRAERDAAERMMQADAEAQRIVGDAVAAFEEAEAKASETIRSVELRVEQIIEEATRARHGEIEQLRAREREVEERIRVLLADTEDLSALRADPVRTDLPRRGMNGTTSRAQDGRAGLTATVDGATIDLTDVSEAISGAIDEWVKRRDVH